AQLRLDEVAPSTPVVPEVDDLEELSDGSPALADLVAMLVGDAAPVENEIGVGMPDRVVRKSHERTLEIWVVAVEIGPDVAGGTRHTFVDGVRLTAILLTDPMREVALV